MIEESNIPSGVKNAAMGSRLVSIRIPVVNTSEVISTSHRSVEP